MKNHDDMQWVALGGMVLAVAAALVLGRPAAARASDAGEAWIDSSQLAREIMAGADLVLVDVRPSAAFARFHLPGAHNLAAAAVSGAEGRALLAKGPRQLVLYGDGDALAAGLDLRRQGHGNVRVLAGGLEEFQASVLTPPSLREDTDEAASKAKLPAFALRRAFFLGDPAANALATWATDPPELTRPTMVSPRWLHERLGRVAVVDVRPGADFGPLHVPGAVHLQLGKLRSRSGDRDLFLLGNESLAAQFGSLGIDSSTPVVICTDDKMHDATLAAVALLRVGHRALAILEGGLLRWASERRPLTDVAAAPVPRTYVIRPEADDFSITADEVAATLGGGTAILDVRPPEFFSGKKTSEARAGHIPGAVNRLYTKDLTRTEDGMWVRPRAVLEPEYAALGLQKDQPVIVHCRTGHTASEAFFTLRYLLGYEKVRWYNGSWTEWAERKDLPAVMGDM